MENRNNNDLIGSLFDLSFTSFITTKLVKLLFILAIVLAGFAALGIIIASFANGFLAGLGGIIIGALVFFVYVLAARVSLELIIIVFRIAENVSKIAAAESGTAAAPVPPPVAPPVPPPAAPPSDGQL